MHRTRTLVTTSAAVAAAALGGPFGGSAQAVSPLPELKAAIRPGGIASSNSMLPLGRDLTATVKPASGRIRRILDGLSSDEVKEARETLRDQACDALDEYLEGYETSRVIPVEFPVVDAYGYVEWVRVYVTVSAGTFATMAHTTAENVDCPE